MPISRTVWALGFVRVFMDISLEMFHALVPLFLTATLGVSVVMVGLIDGVAEATASITKVFSGYLSDRLGKRMPLILIGYSLGALAKPLFALAGTGPVIMSARFADCIGKGLRGAPCDPRYPDRMKSRSVTVVTVVATIIVTALPRSPVLTLMLARKPIVCLGVFVLECAVQLSVPAAAQSLVMRVGMHLVQFFVIVVMPVVQPFMASIMLAII